jgi:hypothetical protein
MAGGQNHNEKAGVQTEKSHIRNKTVGSSIQVNKNIES